jgi:hypothetical protein
MLMAMGVSRNTAAAFAGHVRIQYGDYNTGFCEVVVLLLEKIAELAPAIISRIETTCPEFYIVRQTLAAQPGTSPLLHIYRHVNAPPEGTVLVKVQGGGGNE